MFVLRVLLSYKVIGSCQHCYQMAVIIHVIIDRKLQQSLDRVPVLIYMII